MVLAFPLQGECQHTIEFSMADAVSVPDFPDVLTE